MRHQRLLFGVDNDPSGHVFYDQMRAEHALASVPYTSLIPADQAIPHECLAPVVSAAKQAAIPTVALMAYLKVAVNLQPGHGIANGYHYQDTLTKGSFADLLKLPHSSSRIYNRTVSIGKPTLSNMPLI
ncbi:hypothetical protein [Lacticaseibacillus paracasei]|uniref:hypothetical protein n=1 Tax=Lacticaseibacillus paracasei TaxID=1597 RepID=UPI001CD96923|nr:hypothetical protein [Lacticaseibacillus paracasei]